MKITTNFSLRWVLATLFLILGMPLSALAQSADLEVSITENGPDPAVAGQDDFDTTYTITNLGPNDANNVVAGILLGGSGGIALDPTCKYTSSQGSFTFPTWTIGTIAASNNATLQEVCGVAASSADGATSQVTMSISDLDETDTNSTNDSASEVTSVTREFDLGLSVVDSPDPVVAGSGSPNPNLKHTFTLSRSGPSDAAGVEVSVVPTLPAGVTVSNWTETVGAFDGTTWKVGDWPASENGADLTLTITLTVASSAAECTQCVSAEGTVTAANGTDTEGANDMAIDPTDIDREFDLTLSVTDSPDPVLAGSGAGNLTHSFVLLNLGGPSNAAGVTVDLTPVLPTGVTLDNAVPSIGSFAGTTWTIGEVAPNGGGSLVLTLTVDNSASSCTDCIEAVGTAKATSGTDTNPANNTDVSNPTSIESAEDAPSSFLTTITFTNGYTGSVTVSLSCNNGFLLDQSKDISPGDPVDFIVSDLDFVSPTVECSVTLDSGADGYVGQFSANGSALVAGGCFFAGDPEPPEVAFDVSTDRMNTCSITAAPSPSVFEVTKVWEFEGDGVIDTQASIQLECSPAAEDTGPNFGTVSSNILATPGGQDQFELEFYASPQGTTCIAIEKFLDAAIESDQGCAGGTDFEVGTARQGCTITNTVFFEGIPTMSQYGLALMFLMMLGGGFVGLRRLG